MIERRRLMWFLVLSAIGACGGPSVGSIGAVLSRDSHTGIVHVRETPEGMAAERAGLIPGDCIKMVDGKLVDDLSASQIRALLRGEIGSSVKLTVIRGERVMNVEIRREPLHRAGVVQPRHQRIE